MKDQHTRISGYRDLTQDDIDMMNMIKAHENALTGLFRVVEKHVRSTDGRSEDMRQMSIARTEFESAFMRLVRAVARPVSPWVEPPAPKDPIVPYPQPIYQTSQWAEQMPQPGGMGHAQSPLPINIPSPLSVQKIPDAEPGVSQPTPAVARTRRRKNNGRAHITPFGVEFHKALDRAGIGVRELADKVGMSNSHISGLAYGYCAVKPKLLARICDTIESPPDERWRLFQLAANASGYQLPLANGAVSHDNVVPSST